jgi:ribose 5-phosphate isomerase A
MRMSLRVSQLKAKAARRAVELVKSGMTVGLGHGSTALFAVHMIGKRIRANMLHKVRCIPCSREVYEVAKQLEIPLTTLNRNPVIDLTIDGADEVDQHLNLIKGGGGALLREKIVAQASLREVIIVDESKLSTTLGKKCPVPIEVVAFGWRSHLRFLKDLGAEVTVRRSDDGSLFKTDQNNILLDADFGPIGNCSLLASYLDSRAGIVEHGLFLQIAHDVIVAGQGGVRHLVRK